MKKEIDAHSRHDKRQLNKKHRNKKLLLFIFIPLLLFVTVLGVYVFSILNKAQLAVDNSHTSDGRETGSELREEIVEPGIDHVSVLFIGIDASENRNNEDHALADALILATLNIDDNSVKLLSIPRDSLVYFPDEHDRYGFDKITHSHAFGGHELTIAAVEHFLEVPVDYFVRLNFHAFVDVVDALGGIEFDVPYELREFNSEDHKHSIHLYPGRQKIDGEEALAIARTRRLDNDIERGKRQQQLMEAMLKRTISIGSITRIGSVIEAVEENIATSIKSEDMVGFAKYALSGNLDIEMLNLTGSDLWTDRYYYQVDEENLDETKQILQDHLGLFNDIERTPSFPSGDETALNDDIEE